MLIFALSALLPLTPAMSQPAYVIDSLWLGVKQNRNDNAATVKIIHSGEQIDLIRVINGQANIKTSDGTRGWIDASYLTEQAPIATQLELAQQSIIKNLALVIELEKQTQIIEEASRPFNPETRKLQQNLLLFGSCAIIGGLSFWAGVMWHRHRVQRRLGGLLP
ncbi:MAG: hypothetical protein JKY89_10680 [Immundisolibacteraceae bacterium]|nr:hypothetical protein [Immundisolibacteraceae bacterium]